MHAGQAIAVLSPAPYIQQEKGEKKGLNITANGLRQLGKNHIFVQNQLLSTLFQVDRLVLAQWSALAL